MNIVPTTRFAVIGTALALSVAACSGTSSDSSASTVSTASTAVTNSVAATSSTVPASTGAASCTTAATGIDITWQPQAEKGSTRMGLVALTNKAGQPCEMEGRATVALTNAADEDVAVPTTEVDEPAPAEAFTLPTGSTAFEGIKWSVCDKGDDTCGVGNSLRVTLPGQTKAGYAKLSGFPPAEKSDITMAKLQVGTIQASHEGVLVW